MTGRESQPAAASDVAEPGDSAASAEHRTRGANSSRKVLQLLLSFSERRPSASVAELAGLIGSPVPTTYRYVALLKELQLIEEREAGRYHVTSRVMPLARAAQLSNDLARLARPTMQLAARELRETVMLFQHFEDSAVCVDRVECDRPMRFTFQPGHSLPLGFGASGKMLLATLPEAERERRLPGVLAKRGPGFAAELARITADRHAVSFGELDEGVWACSTPVPAGGIRTTVLSIAGPESRIGPESQQAVIVALRAYAATITEAVQSYLT